jgi:hypothetical protein
MNRFSNRVFKRISLKREKATQLWWIQDPIGVVETMKEGADITLVSMVQH